MSVTVLDEKDVVTRVEHQCSGCLVSFPATTVMHVQKNVDMGVAYSWYTCLECQIIIDHIRCEVGCHQYDEDIEEGFRFSLCEYDNDWLTKYCLCKSCKPIADVEEK